MSQFWDTSKEAPNLEAAARKKSEEHLTSLKLKVVLTVGKSPSKEALPLQDLVFEPTIQVPIKREFLTEFLQAENI